MYKKTEDAILFSVLKNLLQKITNTKTFIDIESRYQVLLVVVFPAILHQHKARMIKLTIMYR